MKLGYCSHCGVSVAITKDGRTYRHGFIRIKKGHVRKIMPDKKGGHDYNACPGSGKIQL